MSPSPSRLCVAPKILSFSHPITQYCFDPWKRKKKISGCGTKIELSLQTWPSSWILLRALLKILYLNNNFKSASYCGGTRDLKSQISTTKCPNKIQQHISYSFGSNMSSLKTAYAAAPATPSPARIIRLYEAPSVNVTGFSGILYVGASKGSSTVDMSFLGCKSSVR